MEVVNYALPLREKVALQRSSGKKTGFVPTMGALHAGHLTLVEKACSMSDFVVVSIFVNPTQFNDPNDLRNYPRDFDRDLAMLSRTGAALIYAPPVEDIYPEPDTRIFSFGQLEQVMEGKHRPGHFNGVAQVVSRLFDIVRPDLAFFGEKDFQQLAIIRRMVEMLNLPVSIVPCPIIREPDGLAMSSRNQLLSPEERTHSALISKTLFEVKAMGNKMPVPALREWVVQKINADPFLTLEYFEIADTRTLQPVNSWDETCGKIACIAVKVGKVRLIDNIQLSE
jgi:pantoate--beta-alanine ligase